jgi:parallel beta-helix repeat protein
MSWPRLRLVRRTLTPPSSPRRVVAGEAANHSQTRRTPRFPSWRVLSALVFMLLCVGVAGATSSPTPTIPWLSKPGTGTSSETSQYYTTISAPATLAAWKSLYGFSNNNWTSVAYYNQNELGFGRGANCRANGSDVACYVSYHGLAAGGPSDVALEQALAGTSSLPTTAMVYHNAINGSANDITFYIYDASGNLATDFDFGSSGSEFAPQACLACHGGTYDSASNSASGASFLPYDPNAFVFSAESGYTLADQQENFRILNNLVNSTSPSSAIQNWISGTYGGNVGVAGTTASSTYVPTDWNTDTSYKAVYEGVIEPSCRSCHIARSGARDLLQPTDIVAWQSSVFDDYTMPHAEVPFNNFWDSTQPALLANTYKAKGLWTTANYIVTRTDDPAPNGCATNDCSLREAIIAANSDTSYNPIITFQASSGTYTLSYSGSDDAAQFGDLDFTNTSKTIHLLGNGGQNTIISGGGIDRVFDVRSGATVRLQHLTVQNGLLSGAAENAGGIRNFGTLTLVDVNVLNNTSTHNGGGLYNIGTLVVNRSRFANNSGANGGGIANAGTATITNSTIDSNTASTTGGGVHNLNSGSSLTLSHVTLYRNSGTSANELSQVVGTLTIGNSVVANTNASGMCSGTITSSGYNLFQQSCTATGDTSTNLVGANPLLTPWLMQGDHTKFYLPLANSPVVDAIPYASCDIAEKDQAHQPRSHDGDGDDALDCDIGAYEYQTGDDLVGHWKLNEGSGTTATDSSEYGNNGTLTNSPTWTTTSSALNTEANSLAFDGSNDYVAVATDDSLDLSAGQFTEALWVYPSPADTAFHGILGYDPGSSVQRYPSLWLYEQTKIHAGFGTGSQWVAINTGSLLTLNTWNHLAATFDGTNYILYVNGNPVFTDTSTFAGKTPYATKQLSLGRVDNYFPGKLDDVRIYNRALSASEIAAFVSGTSCLVETTGDNYTDYLSSDASALQSAVDGASAGATLKVAGTCAGVQTVSSQIQTVYLSKNLTIKGGYSSSNWLANPDPATSPTVLDANDGGRVAYVTSGAKVTLTYLTMQNGTTTGSGAGIWSNATLTVSNSILQSSEATGDGGALYTDGGTLTVLNSSLLDNYSAASGGAIRNNSGTLNVLNSTLANNAADDWAGAISSGGTTSILYSTITANHGNVDMDGTGAGGALSASGSITLKGSIVAGNSLSGSFSNSSANCNGSVTDSGYNLVGSSTGCSTSSGTTLTTNNSMVSSVVLNSLASNGGGTQSYSLRVGSPAFDAIPSGSAECGTTVTSDQHGTSRPQVNACDIGAYESGSLFNLVFTEDTAASGDLTGAYHSSAAWGDYDSDGDLDLLLAGRTNNTTASAFTTLYQNTGSGRFQVVSAGLPGIWSGNVSWADYDSDGDLDILLKGAEQGSTAETTRLYRNQGGSFVEDTVASNTLANLDGPEVAWGDYDNDGDPDLLLGGLEAGKAMYENVAGAFVSDSTVTSILPEMYIGRIAWGDYDNDGDLDLATVGGDPTYAEIYKNDGTGNLTKDSDASSDLLPVYETSVAWGDYDSDGDLDLVITGYDQETDEKVSRIYKNTNARFTVQATLTGIQSGQTVWGDYDNDGDLDLLMIGCTNFSCSSNVFKVYHNQAGSFVDIGSGPIVVGRGDASWADYDNDGDLDILVTGTLSGNSGTKVTKIYENTASSANSLPSAPSGLSATVNGQQVTLNWSAASDSNTSANGLSYNLRVGTSSGWVNTMTPQSCVGACGSGSDGFRKVVELGNVQQGLTTKLNNLTRGTYYWSVQAVDGAFAGSAWATQGSFTITACSANAVVSNANDSGTGSLRQAISDLCDGGTISFASDYSIYLNSTLNLTRTLTISGSGHTVKLSGDSSDDGSRNVRPLTIASTGVVTLSNLTVVSGTQSYGAGLHNAGTLTILNSTLSDNAATIDGGGIFNETTGKLTLRDSTISSNTARYGAGLYSWNQATLSGNTFASNQASDNGGGLFLQGSSSTTIVNTTISGNSAVLDGGGIRSQGTLTMTNSTLSDNSGGTGGGLGLTGTTRLYNSIIANTSAGGDCRNSGTIATNSTTLIEDGTCGAPLTGDPMLSVLGSYSGNTQTHGLLPGSPMIDAGDSAVCSGTLVNSLDQRGFARPASCDIGAFESQGFNIAIDEGDGQSATIQMPFGQALNVRITANNSEPVAGGTVNFSAPTSGASVTAPNVTSTIDTLGYANALITANSIVGSYNVTATVSGTSTFVLFTLTNNQASTIYTDPALSCASNLPCFASWQAAVNQVADGGTVIVYGGTYSESLTLASNVYTVLEGSATITGSMTLAAGTLDLSWQNFTLTVGGNWSNSGGTFTPNQGTVVLAGSNQSISGATTFYHLTKSSSTADTLTFDAGSTQTVQGTLTWQGVSGGMLSLRSSVPGTQWAIDAQSNRTLSYLDVQDSNNVNGSSMEPSGSVDSGNNSNWNFFPAADMRDSVGYSVAYDNWYGGEDANAVGGGYRATVTQGRRIQYRPVARVTLFTIHTYKGPDQGKARVYIDNGDVNQVVDLYSATPQWVTLTYTATASTPGGDFYIIQFTGLGQKNALSSGYEVRLDAITGDTSTADDNDLRMRYHNWTAAIRNPFNHGGSFHTNSVTGATTSLTFTGTQVSWVYLKSPWHGIAQVTIDGTVVGTVDQYDDSTAWYTGPHTAIYDGLAAGEHTIIITVSGTRNAASTSFALTSDGFRVP